MRVIFALYVAFLSFESAHVELMSKVLVKNKTEFQFTYQRTKLVKYNGVISTILRSL